MTVTYEIWMKETYSRIRSRSESLKAIDAALLKKDKVAAKRALINWIDEQNRKKQDWHQSVRNEKKIVEILYKELNVLGADIENQSFTNLLADSYAKNEVRKMQVSAKAKMFQGKQLSIKSSFLGATRTKSKSRLEQISAVGTSSIGIASKTVGAAKAVKGIVDDIKDIIARLTDGISDPATKSEIIQMVLGNSAAGFAADMAPFLGVFSSGAKAVSEWASIAIMVSQRSDMAGHAVDLRAGDASKALEAILQIINRQIDKTVADAAIHSTAFLAKGLSALADGGTASTAIIGTAEKIAQLINLLVDVVAEFKQREAGNELIRLRKFDLDIFNKCPILGCYYIVMQDDSTIMDFDFENMGKENWRQEALRLKYAIAPVIKQAQKLIESSRIEINDFANAKGVYQSTLLDMIRLQYESRGWGLTNAPKNKAIVGMSHVDFVVEVVKGDL